MQKREPDEQEEKRDQDPDPRWFRLLIVALPALAAIATCVEQLARH
ncbi:MULTISPECIES: hypothetical protein [Streptomyces]